MEFKYSVDDIIYLKSYDEVKKHLGLFRSTWNKLENIPLRITFVHQEMQICNVVYYDDNQVCHEYVIIFDAIAGLECVFLPDIMNMI